jgi:hypothetical protein
MKKINNCKLVLLVILSLIMFLFSCSLIDSIQGPSDAIVQEATQTCLLSKQPLMAKLLAEKNPYGGVSIINFRITNKWKKSIDGETIFFYETQFTEVNPKVDIGDAQSEKKCYLKGATIELVKRGNSWYSLTSKCSLEESGKEAACDQ